MTSGFDRTVIYHGTPLTPRAALLEVCKGRAMCVSFFRPDDVEAVEAISPDIMFRQWRFLDVEGGAEARGRMGGALGLVGLLRVVGASAVLPWKVGRGARYARSAKPAQRCTNGSVAVRSKRCALMAHGRANRASASTLRKMGSSLPWLDGCWKALGQAGVSRSYGRGGQGARQPLAGNSHDARSEGGLGLPLHKRGWDNLGAERMAL